MISVIIPTYNREKSIERAARSVLNQTYHDIELIIVDDCSTDDTENVVKSFDDFRVRYIRHEKNQGACVARNTGIDAAKGEYIAFQDSDDSWRPEKLEKQLALMQKYNADICFCKMERHSETDEKIIQYPNIPEGLVDYETLITVAHPSTQMIMAKAKVCREHKFDPAFKRFQDYDWCLSAGRGNTVVFAADVLVDVYLQNDSISNIGARKSIEAYEMLNKKYRDVCEQYPRFYAQNLNAIGNHRDMTGDRSGTEFKEAYRVTGNKKYLIKNLLYRIGLLKVYHGFN